MSGRCTTRWHESIEPVWARFFDFGAGRMPSFLTKLAGDASQAIARNVAELDLVFRRLRAASIWSARDAHQGLRVSLDRPLARYRRALADDVPLADRSAGTARRRSCERAVGAAVEARDAVLCLRALELHLTPGVPGVELCNSDFSFGRPRR